MWSGGIYEGNFTELDVMRTKTSAVVKKVYQSSKRGGGGRETSSMVDQ